MFLAGGELVLPCSSVLDHLSLVAFLFSSLLFSLIQGLVFLIHILMKTNQNSHMLNTLSATSGLAKEACAWAKFCKGQQLLCFMKSAFKGYVCHLVTS